MAKAHQRLALRQVVGVAAVLLLLPIVGPASAAPEGSGTASLHVALRYDAATLSWHGSFRAIRSDGAVIARGRVVDRPRQQNGVDWLIRRKLTTRKGTLRFNISGPVRTPISRLHYLVAGGTGAYAAVQGHGIDVERVHLATATAVMHGVPLP